MKKDTMVWLGAAVLVAAGIWYFSKSYTAATASSTTTSGATSSSGGFLSTLESDAGSLETAATNDWEGISDYIDNSDSSDCSYS
jgi:hypothetical protein